MFAISLNDTIVFDHLYKHCLFFPAVDAEIIARGTVGFSGAELENLVNQAALKAAVDEKEMVTMKDLEFAKDKILMGKWVITVQPTALHFTLYWSPVHY